CCLPGDGVDRLVCHRPVGLRFAANRACPVTGHSVGLIPALLGPGETPHNHLRHYRLVGEDEANWLRSPASCRDDIVPRRSPRSGHGTRGPRRRRFAGVAPGRSTLGVQALGHDPVRAAYAGRAAERVAATMTMLINQATQRIWFLPGRTGETKAGYHPV